MSSLKRSTLGGDTQTLVQRPTWATTKRPWDGRLSLFNARPDNMSKWRAARARAAAGTGTAHVSTFLDSITYGAAASGVSQPKPTNSWPGRLRRLLDARFGAGGSGIVVPWDILTGVAPADDPRWSFVGTISNASLGVHQLGCKRWVSGADANYVEFTATCTEFVVYLLGTGSRPRVKVDGGTEMLIAGDAALDPSLTDPDPLPGYQTNGSNGQIVTVIPAGTLGTHTLRILAPSNGTTQVSLIGVEARVTGQGVRVSNLAHSGLDSAYLVLDDATNATNGMATALDMPRADLAVLLVAMNDFQTHTAVATFKSRIRTAIQRQRSSATYRANGDVLLATCPQPNYAGPIPADGVTTPALSAYYTALYELADEEDVPLLDLAHRWKDYTASNAVSFFGDPVHPNDLGSEDMAQAFFSVLMEGAAPSLPAARQLAEIGAAPVAAGRNRRRTSGRYYTTPVTGITGIAPTQSRLRVYPHYIDEVGGETFDRIASNVTAFAASAMLRWVIYADSSGYPGALVLDTGAVGDATIANGVKEATISQTLQPGRYWLGCVPQGGNPTLASVANAGIDGVGLTAAEIVSASGAAIGFYLDNITGAAPNPFTAGAGTSPSAPMVWLRKA